MQLLPTRPTWSLSERYCRRYSTEKPAVSSSPSSSSLNNTVTIPMSMDSATDELLDLGGDGVTPTSSVWSSSPHHWNLLH